MSCISIHKGHELGCDGVVKKYFQQAVLINKDDVLAHNIVSKLDATVYKHRITFALKSGKTGYKFEGEPNGVSFFGSFSKELDENIPQYTHNVQIPVFGASEESKYLLKTLDYSDYFAAIQLSNGKVEIYGFENGLTTDNYSYDVQGNGGGSLIPLVSKESEDEPPYMFDSLNPNTDFENLFADIDIEQLGDFNSDFNNDFLVGQ